MLCDSNPFRGGVVRIQKYWTNEVVSQYLLMGSHCIIPISNDMSIDDAHELFYQKLNEKA